MLTSCIDVIFSVGSLYVAAPVADIVRATAILDDAVNRVDVRFCSLRTFRFTSLSIVVKTALPRANCCFLAILELVDIGSARIT